MLLSRLYFSPDGGLVRKIFTSSPLPNRAFCSATEVNQEQNEDPDLDSGKPVPGEVSYHVLGDPAGALR